MFQRFLLNGVLIYGATTIDLGLPVWVSAPVLPSFLDLLLIVFCQRMRGSELVVWAGIVGCSQDFVTARTPGIAVMVAATLGLLAVWREAFCEGHVSLSDRLMNSLFLLITLSGLRLAAAYFVEQQAISRQFAETVLIHAAATFLLLVVVNSLWSICRIRRRRAYRLGGQGI